MASLVTQLTKVRDINNAVSNSTNGNGKYVYAFGLKPGEKYPSFRIVAARNRKGELQGRRLLDGKWIAISYAYEY